MDRKTMSEKNDRLEELRAQQNVAEEYGIDHATQSEQEKATKASAEKANVKAEFDRAANGQQMEQEQEPEQQDSQQVKETGQKPRPIPPSGLDRAGAQNTHHASMARDDQAAKAATYKQDFEDFKQREEQTGQQEHDHDTNNNENDHD